MREKQMKQQDAWDKTNARRFTLKLNRNTDAILIEKLESVPSIQGYIKELIKADIKKERQ